MASLTVVRIVPRRSHPGCACTCPVRRQRGATRRRRSPGCGAGSSYRAAVVAALLAEEEPLEVEQFSTPGCRGDIVGASERLRVLGQVANLQPGGDHRVDGLTEGRLPFHRSMGGKGVIDVRTFEVATVGSDPGRVLVPGP
jgi:hypothetical protein